MDSELLVLKASVQDSLAECCDFLSLSQLTANWFLMRQYRMTETVVAIFLQNFAAFSGFLIQQTTITVVQPSEKDLFSAFTKLGFSTILST